MSETYQYCLITESPSTYFQDGIIATELCTFNPQMEEGMKNGWTGNIELLKEQQKKLISALIKLEIPTIVIPDPLEEIPGKNLKLTADRQFACDPFKVNAELCHAMLFQMSEITRKDEPHYWAQILQTLGLTVQHSHQGINEGGNIVDIPFNDSFLILSGLSGRSDQAGLQEATDFLQSSTSKTVLLEIEQKDQVLHLDCAATAITHQGDGGDQIDFFINMEALTKESRKKIEQVLKTLQVESAHVDLHELSFADSKLLLPNLIQYKLNGINAVVCSGDFISPSAQAVMDKLVSLDKIKKISVDLGQAFHTGGAVHCLTNRIFTPKPIEIDQVNAWISKSGLYPPGASAKLFNNSLSLVKTT